jgi:hypothetical protein
MYVTLLGRTHGKIRKRPCQYSCQLKKSESKRTGVTLTPWYQTRDIRIEISTSEGRRIRFRESKSPTKVVLHFGRVNKIKKPASITHSLMKDPLLQYYLQQVGRGSKNGIGPIYAVSPFVQRWYVIGSFLSCLFSTVRALLWSGVKGVGRQALRAMGREALRTGPNIMTDLTANTSPDVKAGDIVARHLCESAQNLIQKMRGKGRRKRAAPKSRKARTKSGKPPKKGES